MEPVLTYLPAILFLSTFHQHQGTDIIEHQDLHYTKTSRTSLKYFVGICISRLSIWLLAHSKSRSRSISTLSNIPCLHKQISKKKKKLLIQDTRPYPVLRRPPDQPRNTQMDFGGMPGKRFQDARREIGARAQSFVPPPCDSAIK
jgi:hypothetical protein